MTTETRESPPSGTDSDRTLGLVLNFLGLAGFVVGIVLLVTDRPVGLLVLMVGIAVFVLGLDVWLLRSPERRDEAQRGRQERAEVEAPDEQDDGDTDQEPDEEDAGETDDEDEANREGT